jgi:mono/diheme cytochrome c family protein
MSRRHFSYLACGAALLAASITIVWLFPKEKQTVGILLPDNTEFVSAGKLIYFENCASCHGNNLEGQVQDWQIPNADGMLPAPPHDETGHTWHHSDQLLFEITKFGVAKAANLENYDSAMPAYENLLSDEEITAVLSYIKSTWPEEKRRLHDEINKR